MVQSSSTEPLVHIHTRAIIVASEFLMGSMLTHIILVFALFAILLLGSQPMHKTLA